RDAALQAIFGPTGPVQLSRPGSIEQFLTERYCLFALTPWRTITRIDIHHAQWPLQPAAADIAINTVASAAGIALPSGPPLLHFSRRLDVIGWGAVRASAKHQTVGYAGAT